MKAAIKPRIDLVNRTRLEIVIPLATPFIINVDPSDRCNFQCKFCPTGDHELMKKTPGRNFGFLDFDLFKKIVDDIGEFDSPLKVLRLYKDGEPLLNPHFADMVRYAKQSGCCDRIDTTTNASLLTPELSDAIIEAGLTRINISIEGVNEEQYESFSNYEINFERLVTNIKYFYDHRKQCEMIVKINGDILTEDQKKDFYNTFGDIADGVFIESIMNCWPTFSFDKVTINKERGIYGQEIREVLVCPYVFYSFSINSNGLASACFLDWKQKLVIGDVKNISVKAIWNSDALHILQKMFLNGGRKSHDICSNCGQLTHGIPDNLDNYRSELLIKLNTKNAEHYNGV